MEKMEELFCIWGSPNRMSADECYISTSSSLRNASEMSTLYDLAVSVLNEGDPIRKAQMSINIARSYFHGFVTVDASDVAAIRSRLKVPDTPNRPSFVKLVDPRKVNSKGKKQFLHALVHAESYAVDLSWDIIARFGWSPDLWLADDDEAHSTNTFLQGQSRMPDAFFDDWVRIAAEEAKHFSKWNQRLEELGGRYGDYLAHDGLWVSGTDTAHSLRARLAIVHMVHEARGLDTYISALHKMEKGGDEVSASIMRANHIEEIGHVAAGRRWLQYLCCQHDPVSCQPISANGTKRFNRLATPHVSISEPNDTCRLGTFAGRDSCCQCSQWLSEPQTTYRSLVRRYFHGLPLRGPFNEPSRERGGLSKDWWLELTAAEETLGPMEASTCTNEKARASEQLAPDVVDVTLTTDLQMIGVNNALDVDDVEFNVEDMG